MASVNPYKGGIVHIKDKANLSQWKRFYKLLKNSNEYNFFMNPTDKNEIINITNNLNFNKSTGPHSIPGEILNIIKLNIAEPLSEIVNFC